MPRMIVAMTPSEPPMIRFVMKPAIAPRTIHAMMPITGFLHWDADWGRETNSPGAPGERQRVRVLFVFEMVSWSARFGCVLDVAQALLRATLDLLCLALGLLRPVAGQLD